MTAATTPRMRGPLQALLWEQYRLTRPVFLLPVAVLLADLGLWFWCGVALEMPPEKFVDLSDWYIGGMCVMALLLLLSQPDRRLELRLITSPRHLRLPVKGSLLLFSSLLIRAATGFVSILAALWIHRSYYSEDTSLTVQAGAVSFISLYFILYAVASPASVWGDRAAGMAVAVGAGIAALLGVAYYQEAGEHPVLLVAIAGLAAVAGGLLTHGLRQQRNWLSGLTLALPARQRSTARCADIPRFNSPIEAQTWYERRRRGWLVPAAAVLATLGIFGVVLFGNQSSEGDLEVTAIYQIGYAFAVLPVAAFVAAAMMTALDLRLFRNPEGRFLLVRPVPSILFSQARMRSQAWAVGVALVCIPVACLLLLAALIIRTPEIAFLEKNLYQDNAAFVRNLELVAVFAFAFLLYPLAVWSTAFLLNRINILCVFTGAMVMFGFTQSGLLPIETYGYRIVEGTVYVALALHLFLGIRAGLLRPLPLLPLLLFTPLLTSLVLLEGFEGNTDILFLLPVAGMFFTCFAGAPMEFHLRRSASWFPPVLDDARPRRREWRKVFIVTATLLLVLAPIYSLYQVAVNRAAAQAIAEAETAIHEVPQEERLYRPELLLRASSIGREIADATRDISDNCGMWQSGAGRAECTQQLVYPIAMAALGELETLMAQPAVPIFSEAFDPFYFTDDLQLNNRRMGLDSVIVLTGALFRMAREAAPTDTLLSTRYLLAAFAISDTANAMMIVDRNTVRGWGSPAIAIQTLRPLVEGKFSDEQLAALQAAVPGQVARQVGTTFLNRDLIAIKDYGCAGDGTSDPLDWSDAPTGVLFWYEALGVRAWDQIAAATTVRDQARSIQGKGVVWNSSNSEFEIPFTPLSDYLWNHELWGYP